MCVCVCVCVCVYACACICTRTQCISKNEHIRSRVGQYQQYLLTVYLYNQYLGMTKILILKYMILLHTTLDVLIYVSE